MNIISYLVLKYLRLNPKRTLIAVTSVIMSVFLLTAASNVFVWGFGYMREVEASTNGSWQARYNGLQEEQIELLKQRDEFVRCEAEKVSDGMWQTDVELKKVNGKIFQVTQNIGKEIGMTSLKELGEADILPNGDDAEYDISYHMTLLDFYGITYQNSSLSMKHILFGVLAIIMGITALLIYSIFSLSFMEKKKYIGLLACVGASLWQRRRFIFGEGIVIGVISIPLGLIAGSFGSIYLIGLAEGKLNEAYQLNMSLLHIPDGRVTALAGALGVMTIIIAILVPTVQAGKVNPLELIFKSGESEPEMRIGKYRPRYSLEFNMALRNLSCNRQKCLKILFFTALTIVVAFNGYITIQEMQRKYLLQDERESKPLDAWVRIYSDDFTLEEQLKEKIEQMPWCREASYLSVLDMGGFTIDRKYVADDLEKFKLAWWNASNPAQFSEQEKGYYGFPLKIVGIDDNSFREYLSLVNGQWEEDTENYPVIIDDYIPVQQEDAEYSEYREVLSIPPGENVKIQYGTYADYFLSPPNLITRTGSEEIGLQVCSSSSNRAPLPIVPGAYGLDTDDYTQMESYYVKMYMPYSAFKRFLQDDKVSKTYGKLQPHEQTSIVDRKENPILSYICVDREKAAKEAKIKEDMCAIMEKSGLKSYNPAYSDIYINDSNSWEYENIELLNRHMVMKNATEILRRIFIVGAILLVLFFTLFSLMNYIISGIYMRRRELSVLKSMGMGYRSLKRMLLYENIILIVMSAMIGSASAYFIAVLQFEEYKEGAATIKLIFPHGVFVGVLLGLLMLTGGIILLAVRKVKNVNILDALKNENE